MAGVTLTSTSRTRHGDPEEELCSVCHRNKVFIGTMCEDCYNKKAYPGGKPGAPPRSAGEETVRYYSDEEIARVIHMTFIGMQMVLHDDMPSPPWMYMTRAQRRSAIAGVRRVRYGGMSARENHENWVAGMTASGWEHGEEKDPHAVPPRHPDLVSWPELNQASRDKAELFVDIVNSLSRERKEVLSRMKLIIPLLALVALVAVKPQRRTCHCCGCAYSRCEHTCCGCGPYNP